MYMKLILYSHHLITVAKACCIELRERFDHASTLSLESEIGEVGRRVDLTTDL